MSTSYAFRFWVVFCPTRKPRITIQNPRLERDERALYIEATLPKSLWSTPQLKATITMDDPGSVDMSLDVAAASDALKSALGVDIDLKIMRPEE